MPGAHERNPLTRVLGLVISGLRRHRRSGLIPGRTCSLGPKHPRQWPGSSGKRRNHARQRRARTGTAHQAAARRATLSSSGCLPHRKNPAVWSSDSPAAGLAAGTCVYAGRNGRSCACHLSQPRPGRRRNNQSRMSPSPQPIAEQDAGALRITRVRDRLVTWSWFRRDVGGRSTISTPLPAQDWRRPGDRSPRSAPGRAGWAIHRNRPPSRTSGRPRGSSGGPGGSGSPGSLPTAARPAQGRRGAHIAGPSRSGLRPACLGPCSGRGSWQPSLSTVEMPGHARPVIHESSPAAPRRKQARRAWLITRTDHLPVTPGKAAPAYPRNPGTEVGLAGSPASGWARLGDPVPGPP
jgi:hypothetical protein